MLYLDMTPVNTASLFLANLGSGLSSDPGDLKFLVKHFLQWKVWFFYWYDRIVIPTFAINNDILDLKMWYFQTDPPASPKQLHFWDRFLLLMLRYFVLQKQIWCFHFLVFILCIFVSWFMFWLPVAFETGVLTALVSCSPPTKRTLSSQVFVETLWWSGCRSKNCRQDGTFLPSRQSLWKLLHLVLHCLSLDLGCTCTLPSCLWWWEFLGFNVKVRKTCRKPRNLCKTRSVCQRWYCSSRRRMHQQEARGHFWPDQFF